LSRDKLKIAVVVHGRFHAFDLVREVIKQGHDAVLFTNYPKFVASRFGIPGDKVRSFLIHGILHRVFWFIHNGLGVPYPEAWMHKKFGKWAERQVAKEHWDVIHSFSGVSEELLDSVKLRSTLKLVMRGSAHIETQARLLIEETQRVGCPVESPSEWMIQREKREYAKADAVVVLSTFAQKSFIRCGINESRIALVPLGVETRRFCLPKEAIQARQQRILEGQPLRVLMVGTFSFRKGVFDLRKIVNSCGDAFIFRFIGSIEPNTKKLRAAMKNIELIPKQNQFSLPNFYKWADLFIFTTIEDGYAVVLAQAKAASLPILTTENSCGPDLIEEGETGWVLPIRKPDTFINRLKWCDTHRRELSDMVKYSYDNFKSRDWSAVALDFIRLCQVRMET